MTPIVNAAADSFLRCLVWMSVPPHSCPEPWFNIAGCSTCHTKQQKTVIPTCLVPLDNYNLPLPNNNKQVPICPKFKELWFHNKARPLENYILTYLSGLYRENYAFTSIFCTMSVFDSYLFVNSWRKISILIIYLNVLFFRMHFYHFCCILHTNTHAQLSLEGASLWCHSPLVLGDIKTCVVFLNRGRS